MAKRSQPCKQQVTVGRFEIEQNGHIASLEYNLTGNVLQLIHTEVPKELQGMGLASELAHEALEWAREHRARVDVICEVVADYINKHAEYADLVRREEPARRITLSTRSRRRSLQPCFANLFCLRVETGLLAHGSEF